MKIQAVKGTRDFYPEDMARRNFIIDGWKTASIRNGFAEFDGPIFEYLAMYQQKSGDEIASQLFAFEDRGERMLAIRPEITPTLARMVNQRINTLPRPIKWFSVPRLCRAERPQKGRLREFFQWNVDIIGVDDCLADAEVIFCAVDYLMAAGLGSDDIIVRISSRRLLASLLEYFGIEESQLDKVYAVLDKKAKVPAEAFEKMLEETISDADKREKVLKLMAAESLVELEEFAGNDEKAKLAVDELKRLFEYLNVMGITEFCKFDIGIVRGLAYYTGIVYEIYDKSQQLRAICGGGRYDNLLADFGGPKISATGMGMGDCVLGIVLEEKGIFSKVGVYGACEYFVAYADDSLRNDALNIVAKLRKAGKVTDFSYKGGGLGKQLKQASTVGAKECVLVGQEFAEKKQLIIKDMASGEQKAVSDADFFALIKR
ncbi:MAG: histidine--tRNA ligase [Planctomycetes bacterium GWF2_41_51]|nr:MAG: histidine--tRNA ligase [Planctomycetes bacterium GWF2_41_51]HBG27042.1 histidine--tRNA ligase [Phycisphaerales bacterium]